MLTPPFYIVLQARDVQEARRFYGNALGSEEITSTSDSVTFDLLGRHWVCQYNPALGKTGHVHYHPTESSGLPGARPPPCPEDVAPVPPLRH